MDSDALSLPLNRLLHNETNAAAAILQHALEALDVIHIVDSDGLLWVSGQGTKLMTPEKARAIWAIYVWCRRTDELVDGPNASRMNPRVGCLM